MNLVFSKIKLHNFFSFVDAELDLNDMGYTLVEGRNYCKLDNAYSNGSGKSSIFNGICFALTGETAQGVSNGIENIFSEPGDCWVELSFRVDNDEFVLKRFKTPKPDLKIIINGEDMSGKGVRESSKLLATYLPDLTPILINSIIILGQGLPNRFTNNNPAQRKEILEKLTKSDFMIQSIKDKLEYRQNELKTDLRTKEDDLLATNSKLSVYSMQLSNYEEDLKLYDGFDNSEDGVDLKISSLQSELSEVLDNINKYNETIGLDNIRLEELNNKYSEISLTGTKELEAKLSPIDNDILDVSNEATNINAEIKALTKEIKKLDSITDICPTCGQKIPNVNRPDTTGQKKELEELSETYAKLQDNINSLRENRNNVINEHEAVQNKLIADITEEISLINDELKNISELNVEAVKTSTELSEHISKLNNLKQNYSKLLSDIENTNNMISGLEDMARTLSGDILNINDHLNIIQQMVTLAKREFRGILLLNIINYINKKVKRYSMEVFGTNALDFSLDENAIDITYCDKPYENLSGGEKQKIDIIVQLALRDVLSKQLNIRSNILVCDEIFDNLDLQGCSKIMNLISSLSDIDSVFIISHHTQDLELTKDNGIVVEKNEEGISSIKFV